jgi:hypothetical protein
MKKVFLLLLTLCMTVYFVGCFAIDSGVDIKTKETSDPDATEAPKATTQPDKKFGLGEKVSIKKDGKELYTLIINSVTVTDERNQFDESNPAQVIIINYTYENIASEDDIIISSMNFKFIDSDGNVCSSYPISSLDKMAQSTPMGAKCTAEEAYGLKIAGGTIKLSFYDNMFSSKADAVFEINVVQ